MDDGHSLAHERPVRVALRTVAAETFSTELREATVRGYCVYQDSWDIPGCSYSVSVNSCLVRESLGRTRIPSLWQWCDRVCTSTRTTGLHVRGGGRIRLGVANQNPQSAKIISAKFCKRPIRENFVPRKFGAIRYIVI